MKNKPPRKLIVKTSSTYNVGQFSSNLHTLLYTVVLKVWFLDQHCLTENLLEMKNLTRN